HGAAPRRRGAMRLLVIGDFSGRPAGEKKPLGERATHQVDIDNFDRVMARLAPRLDGPAGRIEFTELEDFHPDSLYRRLDLFGALRQARAQPADAGEDLLGRLLGKPVAAPGAPSRPQPAPGLEAFIEAIVAPHVVADTAQATRSHLAAVDSAIAEAMRQLLHDPGFQQLESAWRGVQWLISSLELDETLQLHLFDATREELIADVVAAQGQVAQTGLQRALADRWRNQPGAEAWTAVVGLYAFGPSDADIGLLAALGLVAAQAGGPLLAEGRRELAQADDPARAGWQALRGSEAAPWIGLAAPRLLLRLPYGKSGEPIASFGFEEFVGAPVHEDYLWGNPGLAVARLIGRAFTVRGWDFEAGEEREIGDLPAFTFVQDGERELQACAEAYLGEQAGQALLDAGLMPLMSHRHRNAATLMRLQSVASPAARLAFAR
ncbi:MAG: type VI secretion system contractile sheath large subunit, partial [Burkholderiales bacterium]|nr:type VI secretion system contractile sheath large subunit [Burkholderiales bacterium]